MMWNTTAKIALFALVALAACVDRIALAEPPPSILFILTDDLSYEAVAGLGNSQVQTPHIDRLIAEGTTFTHAYNMGGWNGAICIASRTMLNTGLALWKAPQKKPELAVLQQAGQLWSQQLKAAGYRTLLTGKWHIPVDPSLVFDEARNVRGGMPPDSDQYDRPVEGQPDRWSPSDPQFGGFWTGGKHWSEVAADDTVDYLKQSAGHKEPFFIYSAFNAPHDPRQSPAEFVARYPRESIFVPPDFLPAYPHREAMEIATIRDERLAPYPRTPYAVQTHRQEYYAAITYLDYQIGRILQALDESGQRDKTWVIFTADHGLAVGHHGLIGKQNLYDHSVRVPFVVCGPGIAAGRRITQPIYLQDIVPTTLELADRPIPERNDFQSLLPLLKGTDEVKPRAIYGAYTQTQRSVTDGGYKLILYPTAKVARLYHVQSDPLEQHDLLQRPIAPESRQQAQRLFQTLLDLQKKTGDNLPLTFPPLDDQS